MNDLLPTNDQPSELIEHGDPQGLAFVMPDQFPDLERAELGMRIEKKYYEFATAGQTVRAVFNGMDFITSKNNGVAKKIPAIVFQTKEGIWLHSGASLVEQFRTIPPGAPVEIKYLGTEKTGSNNNVKKFDVHLLNVGVKAVRVENSEPGPRTVSEPAAAGANPPAAKIIVDGLEFQHPELATDFWSKAKTMGFSRKEGLAHLAAFENDFKVALEALTTFLG